MKSWNTVTRNPSQKSCKASGVWVGGRYKAFCAGPVIEISVRIKGPKKCSFVAAIIHQRISILSETKMFHSRISLDFRFFIFLCFTCSSIRAQGQEAGSGVQHLKLKCHERFFQGCSPYLIEIVSKFLSAHGLNWDFYCLCSVCIVPRGLYTGGVLYLKQSFVLQSFFCRTG